MNLWLCCNNVWFKKKSFLYYIWINVYSSFVKLVLGGRLFILGMGLINYFLSHCRSSPPQNPDGPPLSISMLYYNLFTKTHLHLFIIKKKKKPSLANIRPFNWRACLTGEGGDIADLWPTITAHLSSDISMGYSAAHTNWSS